MLRPINPYAGKETANPVVIETWSKKSLLEFRVIDLNNSNFREWLVGYSAGMLLRGQSIIIYQYDDDFQFRLFNSL
jgi:hypothetical protein